MVLGTLDVGLAWEGPTILYDGVSEIQLEDYADFWIPPSKHHFGFSARREIGLAGPSFYLKNAFSMPLWFLILVFSAILFVVWRKTRGGVRTAAAFPVEVEKQHA